MSARRRYAAPPPGKTCFSELSSRRPRRVIALVAIRLILCHCSGRVQRNSETETAMEELNGRMIACQILVTGLIARVANDTKDPLKFLSDFRDEIRAVVSQVRIAGALDTDRVRRTALQTVDELLSLMKPPSTDE
jgi:hypothetical protein